MNPEHHRAVGVVRVVRSGHRQVEAVLADCFSVEGQLVGRHTDAVLGTGVTPVGGIVRFSPRLNGGGLFETFCVTVADSWEY